MFHAPFRVVPEKENETVSALPRVSSWLNYRPLKRRSTTPFFLAWLVKEAKEGALFNRQVKLLWSFIVAKWTTSKRFDVTMVHPISRGARENSCFSTVHRLPLRDVPEHRRTHTNELFPSEEVIYFPLPALRVHLVPSSVLPSWNHLVISLAPRFSRCRSCPGDLLPQSSTIFNFHGCIYPLNHYQGQSCRRGSNQWSEASATQTLPSIPPPPSTSC